MIEQADQRIVDWARETCPEAEVSLAPPAEQTKKLSVHAVLISLGRAMPAPGPGRASGPLRAVARYLVFAAAPEAAASHAALGTLMFEAMEHDEFSLEFPEDLARIWTALGCRLRPAFVLAVPIEKSRSIKPSTLVERHVPKFVPAGSLIGVVMATGDVPVADARVEIRSLGVSARTDASGRFRFGMVPRALKAGDVYVTARGKRCRAGAVQVPGAGEPLVIRVAGLEAAE